MLTNSRPLPAETPALLPYGMSERPSQAAYWDHVASEKTFHHPLNLRWLAEYATRESWILDVGCGYGRTLEELRRAGYQNLVGVDFSPGMLARCRLSVSGSRLVQATGRTLPFGERTCDAVLLFTTLTCVPDDDEQHALVSEAARVLRPGGFIYISDLLFNPEERNRARYERGQRQFGSYGVFELPEGAIMRHHSEEWIEVLTAPFSRMEYQLLDVVTMNGNASRAFQYLGRLA